LNVNSTTFSEAALESERLFNEALHGLGLAPWSENSAFALNYVHAYHPSAFSVKLVDPAAAPLVFDFDEIFQIALPGGCPIEIERDRFRGEHGIVPSVTEILTARISVRYSRFCKTSRCTVIDTEAVRKPWTTSELVSLWSNWPSTVRNTTTMYEPLVSAR